jgi:citrate lyase subunit beta / citryl-CoA lyase
MQPTIHPRRSVLYMPGSNARAMEKARTLPVDAVVLDLEDAVAPDAKAAARKQIVDIVKAGGFGRREVVIRVNALDTPYGADDLAAIAAAKPDAVQVPKVSTPEQLRVVGKFLTELGAPESVAVWAMIETPLAVLNIREIAASAHEPVTRLRMLVLGTNDIAKETRTMQVPGRWTMLPALMASVFAARAFGIGVLDGVYNNIEDAAGFAQECRQARELGFDGKTLIHPKQIDPCNEIFSPTAEEVAQARKIVAIFDMPENKGRGAVTHEGRMVERMHADIAAQTIALAEAIKSSGD